MASVERPAAILLLAAEEINAWSEYLEPLRDQTGTRYEELESWAWSRLGRRLSLIQSRRDAIESEDGA